MGIDTVLNGTVDGSQRVVATILDHDCDLTLISKRGVPSLGAGISTYAYGAEITNAIISPHTCGATRYVCRGLALAGNEPAGGFTTSFTMLLTNNATLTGSGKRSTCSVSPPPMAR